MVGVGDVGVVGVVDVIRLWRRLGPGMNCVLGLPRRMGMGVLSGRVVVVGLAAVGDPAAAVVVIVVVVVIGMMVVLGEGRVGEQLGLLV